MPTVPEPHDTAELRRRVAELTIDRDQLRQLRDALERSEREAARIPALEEEAQHHRRRAEIAVAERARLEAELQQVGDLRARLERAERALHDVQTSPSWRLTRPLRAAKRLLG